MGGPCLDGGGTFDEMMFDAEIDTMYLPEPAWLKTGLVYMASPYSHPDPSVMEARFTSACREAARFMRKGVLLFSPIAHTHPIAQFDLPKDWTFWARYDRFILEKCCGVLVLMLDGWEQSKGVAGELLIAAELGLPVLRVAPEPHP
jgi:hypothetical protein